MGLVLRKLADYSGGQESLEADLPGAPPGTWPMLGMAIMHEIPDTVRISQAEVLLGLAEGWITGEGHAVVVRPGGPAGNPWGPLASGQPAHIFHHFDRLTFHFAVQDARYSGADVTYRVVHQPDKYADDRAVNERGAVIGENSHDDATPVTSDIYAAGTTRVDYFYDLEREA